MLSLSVKSKVATFAVILMTTDTQLRRREGKAFMTMPTPPIPLKLNNLDRKPLQRTLKRYDGAAKV